MSKPAATVAMWRKRPSQVGFWSESVDCRDACVCVGAIDIRQHGFARPDAFEHCMRGSQPFAREGEPGILDAGVLVEEFLGFIALGKGQAHGGTRPDLNTRPYPEVEDVLPGGVAIGEKTVEFLAFEVDAVVDLGEIIREQTYFGVGFGCAPHGARWRVVANPQAPGRNVDSDEAGLRLSVTKLGHELVEKDHVGAKLMDDAVEALDVVIAFGAEGLDEIAALVGAVQGFHSLLESHGNEKTDADSADVNEKVAPGMGRGVGRVYVEHVVPWDGIENKELRWSYRNPHLRARPEDRLER